MILIDLSNTFYRSYYVLENKYNDEVNKYGSASFKIDYNILLEYILKELQIREDQFKHDYGKIVLCCDSRSNWRYKYFQEYKQKRKEDKASDNRDWNYIQGEYTKVKQELANNTKYVVLEVNDLEADDLIALACFTNNSDILIVSVDKDLNQLVDNDRIKQFSPIVNDYVTNTHHPLNEAILTGDSSDGVPNIFSDDNHYVRENKIRAKPVSAKIKEYFKNYETITEDVMISFIDDYNSNIKKQEDILDKDKILHNWNRNRLMIDLKSIPKEYYSVFGNAVKEAISLSLNNEDKHNEWVKSIINNKENDSSENNDTDDIDIGDLFD